MSLVSIVVPVYHNATSVPALLEELQQLARRNPSDTFEFVFVDDGSKDNSFHVLRKLAANDERVRVVKLSRNFGSNAAILAGLTVVRGDVAGAIAADLQDPPDRFDEMLALWRGGKQVVVAAREDRDDPWPTVVLANTFYSLFRRFAIKTMPPRGFDFFLVDRRVVDLITGIQENNAYLMGLILWFGFDPAVIHYTRRMREAKYGVSMWTLGKKIKYFIDSFVAFSNVPVRAASVLGILMSFAGAIYALLIVILRVVRGFQVAGWTSIMIVLLIVSGAQLLMLGILGEYLLRTLDETRRRPRFIIDEVIGQENDPNDRV